MQKQKGKTMKTQLSYITQAIFTGLSTSGRTPAGKGNCTVPIINVKDILDGKIVASDLATVMVEDTAKIQRYTVKEHDVLITTRGTLLKSAVVPIQLEGCVISSNLAGIRLAQNAPITPILLQSYFESAIGQQAIFSRFGRAAMQLALSGRDIGEMEIQMPNLQTQRQLEQLIVATKECLRLEKQALELRTRIAQQVISEIFLCQTGA